MADPLSADDRFQRCVAYVCGPSIEGGYTDNPQDPGGPTNHGITLATLSSWRGQIVSAADVQALSEDEAKAIYRSRYWAAVAGDNLPSGVDLIVFDCAVNQGPGRAARILQATANVAVDGVIGPQTLAAIEALNPTDIIDRVYTARLQAYEASPRWGDFGRGWANRVNAVATQARAWAAS